METLRRYQTTAPHCNGILSLIGSTLSANQPMVSHTSKKYAKSVVSPYFQRSDFEEGAPGQEYSFISDLMIKLFYANYATAPQTLGVLVYVVDTVTLYNTSCYTVPLTVGISDTKATIIAGIASTVATYMNTNYSIVPDSTEWLFNPASALRTFANPTRVVNTAYQPSTTNDTLVIGSVEIDASLSLSGGAKGTVTLQYADDSGFTTNVKTDGEGVNGNTGTLTIGLNTVGAGGGVVVGVVPAGKYYRYLTTNVTGTPTYTVLGTQEISM